MQDLVVNITGTGAPGWIAHRFYGALERLSPHHLTLGISRYGWGHVREAFPRVERAILRQVGAGQAVLMGHSQGGLLALLFGLRYPELVKGIVTCGTPAGGSPLCRHYWPVASLRCMTPGSRFLAELSQQLEEAMAACQFPDLVTFSSLLDFLVPPPYAHVPGADNRLLVPAPAAAALPQPIKDAFTLIECRTEHFLMPRTRPVVEAVASQLAVRHLSIVA